MTEPRKPPRIRFRFSLRTLLAVSTAFTIWLGLWVHRAREQHDALANIRNAVSEVFIDYSYQRRNSDPLSWRPESDPSRRSWVPPFLLDHLGPDFFHNVVAVNVLRGLPGKEIHLADELVRLPRLEEL
ncbi:MAG TPA: hypothetical protein VFW73_12740, partial [Lacipirellulaceae bacterium]|nr:hypothetical protein [Lacipirellulaceae bacterium]